MGKLSLRKVRGLDFPGGPVVKTLPCKAGDVGSISARGTKSPRAARVTGREYIHYNKRFHPIKEGPTCRNREPMWPNKLKKKSDLGTTQGPTAGISTIFLLLPPPINQRLELWTQPWNQP